MARPLLSIIRQQPTIPKRATHALGAKHADYHR